MKDAELHIYQSAQSSSPDEIDRSEATVRPADSTIGVENTKRPRILWLDIAKGIGIILVVLGHLPGLPEYLKKAIYLFHMPLFFGISGFLLRPASMGGFAKNRVRSILLPYLSFSLLILLMDRILPLTGLAGSAFSDDSVCIMAIRILIGGPGVFGPLGPLWFLPVLFLASLCYNGLHGWAGGSCTPRMIVAAVGLLLAQILIARLLTSDLGSAMGKLPHVMPVWPIVIIFIWIGHLTSDKRFYRSWPIIVGCVVVGLALAGITPTLDLKMLEISNPALSLPPAIGLSVLACLIATLLARVPIIADGLSAIGAASLSVLCLHSTVIWYLRDHISLAPLLILAVVLSVLAHQLMARAGWSRTLFLGGR